MISRSSITGTLFAFKTTIQEHTVGKNNNLSVAVFVSALAFLLLGTSAAHAEGHVSTGVGSFAGGGVDRIVETVPGGYLGVSANVSLGGQYPALNTLSDSAGCYVGVIQGSVVAEGGLVWYKAVTDIHGHIIVRAGWGAFLNTGGYGHATQSLAYYNDGTKWAPWRSTSNGTFTLNLNVEPSTGRVILGVTGQGDTNLGYFYAGARYPHASLMKDNADPTGAVVVFDTTQLQQCQVKRNVVMNRADGVDGEPQYDDNSFMYGAVSACSWNRMNPNGSYESQPWNYLDTEGNVVTLETRLPHTSGTGYDSDGNSDPHPMDLLNSNNQPTRASKYRVNFPDTDPHVQIPFSPLYYAREQSANSWNATVSGYPISRYVQEYVEIWLRRGAGLKPHASKPAKKH